MAYPILLLSLLVTQSEIPLTVPANSCTKYSTTGTAYCPLQFGTAAQVEWPKLLNELGIGPSDLRPTPGDETLPSWKGKKVQNLVATLRNALQQPEVIAALANRDPSRVPEGLAKWIVPLLRDQNLRRSGWHPEKAKNEDGLIVLPDPWVRDGWEFFFGAVFLPTDLPTIRRHEYDYRNQLADTGQNYVEVWPVEGTCRQGHNAEGPFCARKSFTVQKLRAGYKLGYCQWLVEHVVEGFPVLDFASIAETFVGYEPMQWMSGRHVYLPVNKDGTAIGYVLVAAVGFRVQVKTWLGTFTDEPRDHDDSLRAFLGNLKRKIGP